MNFSKVTRSILRVIAKLHHVALNKECAHAFATAEVKFGRAADQHRAIVWAQDHLKELQTEALHSQAEAQVLHADVQSELKALKSGVRYE